MEIIENSNLKRGIERFILLNGHSSFPGWSYKRLEPWDNSITKKKFIDHPQKEVLLSSIVGTIHCDYTELTSWLEFLGALKKVNTPEILLVRANFSIQDYTNDYPTFICYNGKYWITDGNNRICASRFNTIKSVTASVREYFD